MPYQINPKIPSYQAQDFYQRLQLDANATLQDIRKAYRVLVPVWHSDKESGSHEAMVALNEAYQTLSNPTQRRRYDLQRMAQAFQSQVRPQPQTRPEPQKQPDEQYRPPHPKTPRNSENFEKHRRTNLDDIISGLYENEKKFSNFNNIKEKYYNNIKKNIF
jgi:curved DNA-binding protein CbpA